LFKLELPLSECNATISFANKKSHAINRLRECNSSEHFTLIQLRENQVFQNRQFTHIPALTPPMAILFGSTLNSLALFINSIVLFKQSSYGIGNGCSGAFL